MAIVLNKKSMQSGQKGTYGGRGSKWGNPFKMVCEADREQVCDDYEIYLSKRHDLLRSLDEIRGHDMICFCAPLRCHLDLVVRLANANRQERIDWFQSVRARGAA